LRTCRSLFSILPVQYGIGGVPLREGGENKLGLLGGDLYSIGNDKSCLLLGYGENILPQQADLGLREQHRRIEAAGHGGEVHPS